MIFSRLTIRIRAEHTQILRIFGFTASNKIDFSSSSFSIIIAHFFNLNITRWGTQSCVLDLAEQHMWTIRERILNSLFKWKDVNGVEDMNMIITGWWVWDWATKTKENLSTFLSLLSAPAAIHTEKKSSHIRCGAERWHWNSISWARTHMCDGRVPWHFRRR